MTEPFVKHQAVRQPPAAKTGPFVKRELTGRQLSADEDLPSFRSTRDDASHRSDLNTRLLQPVIKYTEAIYGTDVLVSIAASIGRTPEELRSSDGWLSWEEFEYVLQASRAVMSDEAEFRNAFTFRLRENWGLLGFLVRASSVGKVMTFAVRTMPLISKISYYDIIENRRTFIHSRYYTTKPESRLMCVSRQAAAEAMPTIWNLPSAQIEEAACVAHGDDYCEYLVRWYEQPKWRVVLLGGLFGIILGGILTALELSGPALVILTTLFGAAFGYIYELKRTHRTNLGFGEETNRNLRQLARQNTEAMGEILALNERQRDWSRILEEQVHERTAASREILDRVQKLGEQREVTLRTFSHDLRNPLTVLRAASHELRDLRPQKTSEYAEIVSDVEEGISELDRLIADLIAFANETGRTDLVELKPAQLELKPLADRLRRRLRALIMDRDVRVSVFCSREMPSAIETDLLVFDRVVDNLLANAAKYTEQGSIILELTGSPVVFTVKVSDTGPGIADERIERVFQPGEKSLVEGKDSYGLGLAIVVHLLDQIGGRLEVMSKPDTGTTFWVHFPVVLPCEEAAVPFTETETMDDVIGRVVTVRRTS